MPQKVQRTRYYVVTRATDIRNDIVTGKSAGLRKTKWALNKSCRMEFPLAGRRLLRGLVVQESFTVGRPHVAMLMKRMGIEAPYRKPKISDPNRALCGVTG